MTAVTYAQSGIVYKSFPETIVIMASTIELKNELYALLSDEMRRELAKNEQTSRSPRGTILVQCGVSADRLTILNSGTAETSVLVGGKMVSLGVAGPGKVFGLHSVLSGEASHTSVICREECGVTVLPKDAFLGLLRRHPEAYVAVARLLSADLATANYVIRDHNRRPKKPRRKTVRPA